MSYDQGSIARISVSTALLTSGDGLEIDSDRDMQHRLRQASDVPDSVGSLHFPLSPSSSRQLAFSLPLPRRLRQLSLSCQLLRTRNL